MITNPLWYAGAVVLIVMALAAAKRRSWAFMRFALLITVLYVWFT
jgi:hypothetical protein